MLDEYLNELLDQIQTEFEQVKTSYDIDAIHDMRVNIKRLRAVCGFLQFVNPGFDAKQTLRPFRSVFKKIGGIRDIQVPLQLISELNNEFDLHEDALIGKLQKDEKELVRLTGAWLKNEEVHFDRQLLISTASKYTFSVEEARKYLDDLLESIRPVKLRYHARSWHKKRVKLKAYHHLLDALYAMELLPADESEMKLIRIVESLIGDWHDRLVTLSHLREWGRKGSRRYRRGGLCWGPPSCTPGPPGNCRR